MSVMSNPLAEGQQPVMPLPEREPVALRAAVARLDPRALRIVADSPDRAERRAAAAEISRILQRAQTATA
jgi:hypothetical protein